MFKCINLYPKSFCPTVHIPNISSMSVKTYKRDWA